MSHSPFLSTLFFAFSIAVSGCAAAPVVPDSAAPPPEPGTGWFCSDFKQSSGAEWSDCSRLELVCSTVRKQLDGMTLMGITTTISPCMAQETAWCTYSWRSNAKKSSYSCMKTKAECDKAESGSVHDGTTKRSACRAVS